MSDLISRSELIRYINEHVLGASDWAKEIGQDFIDMVEKQPTAYDMDRVVEKLEHDAQMLYSLNAFEPVKAWRNDLLIPVVKGGGIGE